MGGGKENKKRKKERKILAKRRCRRIWDPRSVEIEKEYSKKYSRKMREKKERQKDEILRKIINLDNERWK